MGKPPDSWNTRARSPVDAPVDERMKRLPRVRPPAARGEAARSRARAAWTAACPSATDRLPAGQPHPRLERPGLPRPLAGGARRACTRPTTSPSSPAASARRRARRPACSASTTDPVTIKQIEHAIIDHAWDEGWVEPAAARRAHRQEGRRDRLRARPGWPPPQQLNRAGHAVTVFERADRIGGLLTYGIPDFKLDKQHRRPPRRADARRGRGLPAPSVHVGVDITVAELRSEFDAVVPRRRRRPAARPARPGPRARGRPLRHGVPHRSRTGASPADPIDRTSTILRHRQARDRHRRRRHRHRLRRHAQPPGRGLASPARNPAASRPTTRTAADPWPYWPHDAAHLELPRRGLRPRLERLHQAASSARTAT